MAHLIQIFLPLIFFSLACCGAGASLLRANPGPKNNGLETLIITFILGQGIFGTVLLIPALAGIFTEWVIFSAITPFFLVGAYVVWHLRHTLSRQLAEYVRSFKDAHWLWQLLSIATMAALFGSFASISGSITDDARAFYLALPKVIAASHELQPLPGYESFTSVGLITEMQVAVLFLLGMPGASPRLFSWITGMVCAAALALLAREAGIGKRGVVVALAVMTSSSAVGLLWGQGKTELYPTAFGFVAALYALRAWEENRRKKHILFAGLMTGFALVGKLTYLVAFLPCMYLLLFWPKFPQIWQAIRRKDKALPMLRAHCLEGLLFGAAFLPALVPHLAKNIILLHTLVDTYGSHAYFSAATTRYIVATYPLLLTYGNYWGQFGNMSPLLLAFLPLAILSPRLIARSGSNPLAAILFASLLGLVCWIVIFPAIPMPRYFMATILLLAIPAGAIAERIANISKTMRFIATSMTLLVLGAYVFNWRLEIYPVKKAVNYLFVDQSEKSLVIDEYKSYQAYETINRDAPPGARVLLLSYFRFWLRPDLLQCVNGEPDHFDGSGEWSTATWQHIYEGGFTYIFSDNLDTSNKVKLTAPSWVKLETISSSDNTSATAFRLTFDKAPGEIHTNTQEIRPGTWRVIRSPPQESSN